jgi:hypothetical protein
MSPSLRQLLSRLRQLPLQLARVIQWVLVTVLLTLIYVVGVGLTAFYARIFRRRELGLCRAPRESYWEDCRSCSADPEDALRQS